MPIRTDGVEAGLLSRIESDGIPVIDAEIADRQEIHPLTIGLANMMPAVAMETTEVQWSRMATDPVMQTNIELIKFDDDPREGMNRNTGELRSRTPVLERYSPFSKVKEEGVDCLVVTGDNLEVEPYDGLSTNREPIGLDEISYRQHLRELIDWSAQNVPVTVLSCLAAHFGLNYLHEVPKKTLDKKVFGIFEHEVADASDPLVQGMSGGVIAPHSRWGDISTEQIEERNKQIKDKERRLKILAQSPDIGWLIIKETLPGGNIIVYLQGHPEYDCEDLKVEYDRDRENGQELPVDYFPDNDPDQCPRFIWEPYTRNLQRNILGEMYRIAESRRTEEA